METNGKTATKKLKMSIDAKTNTKSGNQTTIYSKNNGKTETKTKI